MQIRSRVRHRLCTRSVFYLIFFGSRTAGVSAKVKSMSSSPVTVLMS